MKNQRQFNRRQDRPKPEFEEKIVDVARVTRVVKGGRRMRFRTLVVIGDRKGRVGAAVAKSIEVPVAAQKAAKKAKQNMINVPITDSGSIPHEIKSRFASSTIFLKPAPEGSSLVSGGSARTVLELAGLRNVVSKSLGSNSKLNCVFATIQALSLLKPEKNKKDVKDNKEEK